MSVLGTHLYQCTSWHCCERMRFTSVNFFEDSFNMFVRFLMGNLQVHLPTLSWVFSSCWFFLIKNSMTPLLHPPYSPDFSQSNYFCVCFSKWKKKCLQRETFSNVEEVKQTNKQKMTEALKGTKTDKFKNCLEQPKKHLDRHIASSGEYFEGDWSFNM